MKLGLGSIPIFRIACYEGIPYVRVRVRVRVNTYIQDSML